MIWTQQLGSAGLLVIYNSAAMISDIIRIPLTVIPEPVSRDSPSPKSPSYIEVERPPFYNSELGS